MPASEHRIRPALILLLAALVGSQSFAAASNDPTTWWPDPTTGLMWAGQQTQKAMTWQEATNYCAALQLGGYSGWRLPTVIEMSSITDYTRDEHHSYLEFKDGISAFSAWTSTLPDDQHAWFVRIGEAVEIPSFERFLVNGPDTNHLKGKLTTRWGGALCTRPMEADLLQIAKDAQVSSPVPDMVTLKAYVVLNKARAAYGAGQYQESLAQAQNALQMKPGLAPAYWGIGISYGMLGQWDLAVTNLETALKIDKKYGGAKNSLKWAKEGQQAAKKNKAPKAQSPQWNRVRNKLVQFGQNSAEKGDSS
jgi:tetratricopeptide (TPR) repeat protein